MHGPVRSLRAAAARLCPPARPDARHHCMLAAAEAPRSAKAGVLLQGRSGPSPPRVPHTRRGRRRTARIGRQARRRQLLAARRAPRQARDRRAACGAHRVSPTPACRAKTERHPRPQRRLRSRRGALAGEARQPRCAEAGCSAHTVLRRGRGERSLIPADPPPSPASLPATATRVGVLRRYPLACCCRARRFKVLGGKLRLPAAPTSGSALAANAALAPARLKAQLFHARRHSSQPEAG